MVEEAMTRAQIDAGRRYNGDNKKSVSRFGIQLKLTNSLPQSEKLLELLLASEVPRLSKKDLRGKIFELASGSTVLRTSPATTVNQKPRVPEVRVGSNCIAKFRTKGGRNTRLLQYA